MIMNKPEKEFRCGAVSASIWANDREVEGQTVSFFSVRIDKAFKEGNVWKHTSTFSVDDLPKVALVANEAYRFITLKERIPELTQESTSRNQESNK